MQPKVSADQIIRFGELRSRSRAASCARTDRSFDSNRSLSSCSHSWLYTPGKPSRARRFSKLFGKTGPSSISNTVELLHQADSQRARDDAQSHVWLRHFRVELSLHRRSRNA